MIVHFISTSPILHKFFNLQLQITINRPFNFRIAPHGNYLKKLFAKIIPLGSKTFGFRKVPRSVTAK